MNKVTNNIISKHLASAVLTASPHIHFVGHYAQQTNTSRWSLAQRTSSLPQPGLESFQPWPQPSIMGFNLRSGPCKIHYSSLGTLRKSSSIRFLVEVVGIYHHSWLPLLMAPCPRIQAPIFYLNPNPSEHYPNALCFNVI